MWRSSLGARSHARPSRHPTTAKPSAITMASAAQIITRRPASQPSSGVIAGARSIDPVDIERVPDARDGALRAKAPQERFGLAPLRSTCVEIDPAGVENVRADDDVLR